MRWPICINVQQLSTMCFGGGGFCLFSGGFCVCFVVGFCFVLCLFALLFALFFSPNFLKSHSLGKPVELIAMYPSLGSVSGPLCVYVF